MKIPRILIALTFSAALGCSGNGGGPSPTEPKTSRGLVELLRSGDPAERVVAAEEISNAASEGVLDDVDFSELLPSLHDRNRFVRASIVSALGAYKPSRKVTVALWDKLLRDPSSSVRMLSAKSLLQLGESHSKILSADSQEMQRRQHRRSPFATMRPPVGWIAVDPFRVSSPELECAKRSNRSWEAGFLAGALKIRRVAGSATDSVPFARPGAEAADSKVQPVEDGWLFASGDKLAWYSLDGKHRRPVASGRFTGFLREGDAILAFRELPYPASSQGEILSLSRADPGIWSASLVDAVDFPILDAAKAPNGSLFLLTTDTIEIWSPNGVLERAHVGGWGELEPRSLALGPDGVLYVGMKHGIARLLPTGSGYFEQWLVPLECPVNTKNGACGCFGNEPDDQTVPLDLHAIPIGEEARSR